MSCFPSVLGLSGHFRDPKTQLMYSAEAGNSAGGNVFVDSFKIVPSDSIELLGVRYDRRLTTKPHDVQVDAASRQRASLIARLTHHLPRGPFLRQLATGLVVGKISHALPAVLQPRLTSETIPRPQYTSAQAALNYVARLIIGATWRDHIPVRTLLHRAGLQSISAMATIAVAMVAWKAFHSTGGGNGRRNEIGELIFDSVAQRTSRATSSGLVQVPLRGHDTLVTKAANIWNASKELREAKTECYARKAVATLAALVPL
jgi:hypothetical protein